MKKLLMLLPLCLAISALGCYADFADAQEDPATPVQVAESPTFPQGDPNYGCVIVQDQFGEREVCNVYYYPWAGGVLYYDNNFNMWIGPTGYWYGGVYRLGFWEGYHRYYGTWYHERGWFHGHAGWWSHGYYNGRAAVGYRAGHAETYRHTERVHASVHVNTNHGGGHYGGGGYHGGGRGGGGHGGHR